MLFFSLGSFIRFIMLTVQLFSPKQSLCWKKFESVFDHDKLYRRIYRLNIVQYTYTPPSSSISLLVFFMVLPWIYLWSTYKGYYSVHCPYTWECPVTWSLTEVLPSLSSFRSRIQNILFLIRIHNEKKMHRKYLKNHVIQFWKK